jgi:hypothetical protein
MSVTYHIKILQALICYLFQLLNRGFIMLTPALLKETHAIYRIDDLVKIILIYV